jgi:hypothetical protein
VRDWLPGGVHGRVEIGGVCEARVPAGEGIIEVQEQAGPLGHLDHRLGCAQHVPRLIEVCPLPAPLEPLGQEAAEIQPGGPGGVGVEQFRAPTGRAAADERSRRRAGECGRLTIADCASRVTARASAW